MCGIFCSIGKAGRCEDENCLGAKERGMLWNRGPDAHRLLPVGNALFGGFVLWQQGDNVCEQPLEVAHLIVLFNGDIFNANHSDSLTNVSDTTWLANSLAHCDGDAEICRVLRTIEGPYSLIFFNKVTEDLYFARDSLGRNSLLIENTGRSLRLLSSSYFSASGVTKVCELPPFGLYKLNVSAPGTCDIFPWSLHFDNWKTELKTLEEIVDISFTIKQSIDPPWLTNTNESEKYFNFYEICNGINADNHAAIIECLLNNKAVLDNIVIFSGLLEKSVENRIASTPPYCKDCISSRLKECRHSKIAILFSGGVDCSILAILADKYTNKSEPIDLINVAFEQLNTSSPFWEVPDRISSRNSLNELKRICPHRQWNFIEVNVPRTELHAMLCDRIKHLIYPLNTVLDESLGCAFWFASRGKGTCADKEYTSSARVVIVGSGADELFGGYLRHKHAYIRTNGTELDKQNSLHRELENDWHRIPSRNLARDDRVIGDNGITSRAPFIEENLVQYVRSLQPHQRCCYLLEDGLGDKLFLRLYAYKLGLRDAVFLKKRAIQFGSKIALKKQKGSEESVYLNFK